MKLILPKGVSQANFDKAMQRFAGVVGAANVYNSEDDRDTYLDPYAPGDPESYGASAAVAPASVQEVQAVLRIAGELGVPLWPISRGKNLGYGGSAPAMQGTVILDLNRMKRILEVNEEMGYVVVEPGVGFYDLFDHLKKTGSKLWMSAPAQTWGSVMGNAMERGVGYTPYGDHASKVCGIEVVLPSGEIMRTGMGAMDNNASWHLFKYGFGPDWLGAFMQSNMGVVTKMGLWMMPEPESSLQLTIGMPNDDDLGPVIDTLRPLKLAGIIQSNPSVANIVRNLAMRYSRDELWQGDGAMPAAVLDGLREKTGAGRWNFGIRLFGREDVNAIHARVIKDAFAKITKAQFKQEIWRAGEPPAGSGQAVPGMNALSIVNWRGGRGGHIDFSPISPPRGEDAVKQYRMARSRFEEFGFDYYGGFTVGERYLNHVTMIIYDRDDPAMTGQARKLFATLVDDAAKEGYGEYRTHVAVGDKVAGSYGFNNHALMRFSETVKDAIDPKGILAPGKSGIWPKPFRGSRA